MDNLRIQRLDSFVGQDQLVNVLSVNIIAARRTYTALRPTLLVGPAGFGKTTLASAIADGLDRDLETLVMPVEMSTIERRVRELGSAVLFLDELHNASRGVQEALYPLLEFGYMFTKSGRRIKADPMLSIVAATTERQKILPPLYDRFQIRPTFMPYTLAEMVTIGQSMAARFDLDISESNMEIIANAAAGVPRAMGRLIEDASVLAKTNGRSPSSDEILSFAGVGFDGLTNDHLNYLNILYRSHSDTVGLNNIASALGLHAEAVEPLEKLLIERRYIERTGRGRELTSTGRTRIRDGQLSHRTGG